MRYPNSIEILENDLAQAPDTSTTDLARRLIEGAQAFDLEKTKSLGVNFKLSNVTRNLENPPQITIEEVALADWADPRTFPLKEGEKWNEGRRATNTGTRYQVFYSHAPNGVGPQEYADLPDHKKDAIVINPYMNTGLRGRGCLGRNGPNHAVDNGILIIQPDERGKPALHCLGILRKYDNDAPALSGGFAKFRRDESGAYVFDAEAVIDTKTEELFEEMISGSIELLPEYRDRLPLELAMEVQNRALSVRNPRFKHRLLTEDEIKHLQIEIETRLKLEQVKDMDPGFWGRLRQTVAEGRECFAGPVLNDSRNTNNAWIETRGSWFLLNEEIWASIKGDNPVFDYQFSAGDDASGVVLHKIDRDLVKNAFASHGAMFAFMSASFLLDAQRKGLGIDPSIRKQLEDVALFFENPDCEPAPGPDAPGLA